MPLRNLYCGLPWICFSAEGIVPLLSSIEAVQGIPEPTSSSQVASFLGMTLYYMCFLPHYSNMTAPLRRLLRKDAPWAWSPKCAEAFSTLKDQQTSPPVLAHFDISSSTFLTCDAFTAAVGAVLSQVQDSLRGQQLSHPRPCRRQSNATMWMNVRHWPACGHASGGIYSSMVATSLSGLTTRP